MAAEAALEAPVTAADAADVMSSAMNDAHAMLQRLKVNVANGRFEMADATALGAAIDRAARIAKLVHDAGIEERKVRVSEEQGRMVAGVMKRSFDLVFAELLAALADDDAAMQRVQAMWSSSVSRIVPQELRALGTAEVVR